jgi:chloramphenicol-sensitive protein RarD
MDRKGILCAIGAYLMWGLFPLYWKQLETIPALQLIGHRIAWSFILLLLVILLTRQWRAFRSAALEGKTLRIYLIAGVLISLNWFTYVWAVTHDHVVETSLGYYINPLFSVLLGVTIFREHLRPIQWMPIGLAALGVLYLTISFGTPPWIALTLAFSFGLYGLVKKTAPLGSLYGLTLETGMLFLPALAYLVLCETTGQGAFLHSSLQANWMMVGAGLVTTVPLLLFAYAAPRVPLTTIGILQYVNPTMQFLLGVLLYREPFTHDRLIGFGLVWAGLILFWGEGLYSRRNLSPEPVPELGEG